MARGVAVRGWPGERHGNIADGSNATGRGAAAAPEADHPDHRPTRRENRLAASRQQARVVVSAFGCDLPDAVRREIAAAGDNAPLWVDLEYLSAEAWVEGCHGLRSIKPADGAIEHFFYPGFTPATGGLLREQDLLASRDAFLAGGGPRDWLAARGLAAAPGERLLSVFCYPSGPADALFASLAADDQPCRVLLPEGIADAAIEGLLGAPLAAGSEGRAGRLTIRRFALMAQDDYDRLLWSCDLNFVRGEDSWIRAHWAGRPFVWQPYVQADGAHLAKLAAFLDRFEATAGPIPEIRGISEAWNGVGPLDTAWKRFSGSLDKSSRACARWARSLATQRDLASSLLEFCVDRL